MLAEEKGLWRPLTVRAVVLTILLFIARKANPATARLGQFVMTGLMVEMVRCQKTLDSDQHPDPDLAHQHAP